MSDNDFPRPCWVFDPCRRLYPAVRRGPPIYREKFVERELIGETRVSWIVKVCGATVKFAKDTLRERRRNDSVGIPMRLLLTREAMEDDIWRHENSARIERRLSVCRDVAKLKAIDVLLGGAS